MISSSQPDWGEIRALLERAFELEPAARAAFLNRECPNSTVRREVESLLDADEDSESLVERPMTEVAGDLLQEIANDDTPHPGDSEIDGVPDHLKRVGSYELLKPLGRGGMGSVYLAKRSDFKKLVAIKLIRRGMDTDDIVQRFRNERQILASLDHANIARLLDGGMTEEGLPYFVMEYVEGLPIDLYCDRHKLSVPERLQLFRVVCDAVQFAHQNLVVHRDLKPSNIHVLPTGEVKLLDFGIAKLLNPEMASSDVVVTFQSRRFLTPEYASPEQVRGEPVTTATDVYALGVLLYEILTGSRPYRTTSRSPRELEQSIISEDPVRPSTAIGTAKATERTDATADISEARGTQPERLRRALRGDLDNIVLMAMRKEPVRRYASARELGDDIQRHLSQLPIRAQKDTVRYRLGKFTRRNKVGVASAVVIALSLVAGLVGLQWQRNIARDQRDTAQRETERANTAKQEAQRHATKAARVTDLLVKMFEVAHKGQTGGEALTAPQVLEHGTEWIQQELLDEPEMHASMLLVVARIYHTLGLWHDRLPLLRQTVGIRRQLYPEPHIELVRAIRTLAEAEGSVGNAEAADRLFAECMAMVQGLYEGDHGETALTLTLFSYWTGTKGERETTLRMRRESLDMRRRIWGDSHLMVAQGLNDYGFALNSEGRLAEAEAAHREALAIRRRHNPLEYGTAISLSNLGVVLAARGEYDEAIELMQQSLELRLSLFGAHHHYTSIGQRKLGEVYLQLGKLGRAEELFTAALGPTSESVHQGHWKLDTIHFGLTEVRLAQGRIDEAADLLRTVKESQAGRFLSPFQTAWRKVLEGVCLGKQLRYDEGEELLQHGYNTLMEQYRSESVHCRRARAFLVDFYEAWGKPERAPEFRH
ncbi:MAG: serine/threonine-protein kinase [Planctomycetota bacterium]